MGTSDRVVGRPRTGCVARVFYCECMHPRLVNAFLTNICSIVTHTVPRPAEPGRIVRVCPTCLRFQNVPDRRVIRDTIVTGNDTPRVSDRKRERAVSDVVKCPDSEPRAFLFARAEQMPSTVRTARAPTDLKPNLIRVKKRDDERAHRREGSERVKEFQHLGTSDRVVGRPRTGCVARVFYCECMHPRLVNAFLTNICSIVTHTVPRPAEPGRIVRVCPTCLRFQNVPDRRVIRDTIVTGNDTPRVSDRKRERAVSDVVKCPDSEPRAFLFARAEQMPSTVRTARAPTDLKPNLIRVKTR